MNSESVCLHIVEVFRTARGSVNQCNKSNRMIVEFMGTTSSFKIKDFMDFTARVQSVGLPGLFCSSRRGSDITIISPHYSERCFVLDVNDLLGLQELLQGAKAMILLNSLIRSCMLQYS